MLMKTKTVAFLVFIILLTMSVAWAQGPLTPPGAPGETMKSLTQVYDKATSAVQAADNAASIAADAKDPRTPIYNPRLVLKFSDAAYYINEPGSYYLAENITGWAGKMGIKITTGSVTLDLNGFSLIGAPTSTHGISITGGSNHIIKNGTIRNWSLNGVYASAGAAGICENIISASNGGSGIALGASYKAIKCIARDNQGFGFVNPAPGAILEDCTATSNAASGFYLNNGIAVKCTSNYNNNNGFYLGDRCRIDSCTSNNNRTHGVYISAGGNTVLNCTVSDSNAHGIFVASDNNQIKNNNSTGNGIVTADGSGILVYTGAERNCIDSNTIQTNDYGIRVIGTKNVITRNIATGNISNYSFASDNGYAAFSLLGSATNPWANVFY